MIAIAPIKSLPDGSVATIPMSWAEYQQLVAKRGDRSTPRLKYANGYLTLKMPTFEHGQLDAIVADLIVALLSQQLRDFIFRLTAEEGCAQTESSQFFPDIDVAQDYEQVITAIAEGISPPRAIRLALEASDR